jgi:hypothetical protein
MNFHPEKHEVTICKKSNNGNSVAKHVRPRKTIQQDTDDQWYIKTLSSFNWSLYENICSNVKIFYPVEYCTHSKFS